MDAYIQSDGDYFVEIDEDSEEELESTARVLDITRKQCSLITQASSVLAELLDDDDDRMGDHQDGDHSVDPLRGATIFLGECSLDTNNGFTESLVSQSRNGR